MTVLLRGGRYDGRIIEVDASSVRMPMLPDLSDSENWQENYPGYPVPRFGLVTYHQTDDIVDGHVVFSCE